MTELAQKELKEQEKRAIEMAGYLKDLAATYDLTDDEERHRLRRIAAAFIEEQIKYEYMRLQAGPHPASGHPLPAGEGLGVREAGVAA